MTACPVCPGAPRLLGVLGTRSHYRCEDCGCEFSARDVEVLTPEQVSQLLGDVGRRRGAHPG